MMRYHSMPRIRLGANSLRRSLLPRPDYEASRLTAKGEFLRMFCCFCRRYAGLVWNKQLDVAYWYCLLRLLLLLLHLSVTFLCPVTVEYHPRRRAFVCNKKESIHVLVYVKYW